MDPQTSRGVRAGIRLAFRHHPSCGWFAADVVGLGPVRICQGCLATWPLFVLSFFLALRLLPTSWAWGACVLGLLAGVPQLVSYLWRAPRAWRVTTKLLGGSGLGLLIVGILLLPVATPWKFAAYAAMGPAFLALQAVRLRSILRTCAACPWKRDWEHCPGFLGHGVVPDVGPVNGNG